MLYFSFFGVCFFFHCCCFFKFSCCYFLFILNGWIALRIILGFFAEGLLLRALILKCIEQMLSEVSGGHTTAHMDPQITAQCLKWQLSTKFISHFSLPFWSKFGFLNHYCKFGINIGFSVTSARVLFFVFGLWVWFVVAWILHFNHSNEFCCFKLWEFEYD